MSLRDPAGKRLGHPVRSLRTPFARSYEKAEYGGMPDAELETLATGALRLAVQEGDDVARVAERVAPLLREVTLGLLTTFYPGTLAQA